MVCVLLLVAAAGCRRHRDPVAAAKIDLRHRQFASAIEHINSAPAEIRNTYEAQVILAEAYKGEGRSDEALAAFERAAHLDTTRVEPFLGMAEVEVLRVEAATTEAEGARLEMLALQHCRRALAIDSKNSEAHALAAHLHERREEFSEAIESHKKAIASDPTNPKRKLELAELHLGRGKTTAALSLVESALAQAPNLAEGRILKALIFRRKNDNEGAKKELRLALADKKIDQQLRGNALNILAYLCLETGETDEAKQLAERLKKYEKFRGNFLDITSRVLMLDQEWEKAHQALKPLEGAERPSILMRLAITEEHLDMENQAIGHYRHIVEKLNPNYLPAHLNLARLMLKRRLYDEAMGHCGAVLRERPGHTQALRYKAVVHRAPSGRHHSLELARLCYLKVLAQNRTSADPHLDLAELYLETNQPRRAMAHAKEADSLGESARSRLLLGRTYLLMHRAGLEPPAAAGKGNMARAIQDLTRARELAPEEASVVLSLARAHIANGEPETAVKILNGFVSRNPQEGRGYTALASVYESMDNLSKAILVLEKAAKVDGIENFDGSSLGRAYFLAGKRAKALETWQKMAVKETGRTDLSVSVGLGVVLAVDGQHENALTQAETIAHQAGQRPGGALVAACIAIQAGRFDKARQFLENRDYAYASPKEKQAYLEFCDLCEGAGDNGKRAAALISQGLLHIEFGRAEAALPLVTGAAQLIPNSIIPYYIEASAMLRSGRLKDLADVYHSIFEKFPSQGYPHFRLAILSQRLPVPAETRQQVELALDLDPEIAGAHTMLAQILLEEAKSAPKLSLLEPAVEHAAEAVKLDGGTMASLAASARAHSTMAKFQRDEVVKEKDLLARKAKRERAEKSSQNARGILRTLQNKFPNSIQAVKERVRFEIAERKFSEAASLANEFIQGQQREDAELRLLLVTALSELGRLGEAEKQLAALIRFNPTNLPAYRLLAQVYGRMERPQRVIATLRRAERYNPLIAFDLAKAYLEYGQPADAKEVYDKVLDGIPGDERGPRATAIRSAALLGVAKSLMQMPAENVAERSDNLAEAASRLERLTRPQGGEKPDPGALVQLGLVREEQKRELKALEAYEKCAEIAPNYVPAHGAMARLYYQRGEYDKVIDIYTTSVVPLSRYDPGSQARLAVVYLARGAAGDASRAVGITEKMMDYVARWAQPPLGLSPEQHAYCGVVRVLALIAGGKYAEARAVVSRFRGMAPMSRRGCLELIDICSRDEARRSALVSVQSAGLFYQGVEETGRAIDAFEKANKLFPGNPYLLTQLASLYRKNNDMAKVVAVTEKLISAAEQPNSFIERGAHQQLYISLIRLYVRGLDAEMEGALEKALEGCKRGLEKWPESAELLNWLAATYAAKGQKADAVRVLEQIVSISAPGNKTWVAANKRLAMMYFEMDEAQKAAEICANLQQHIDLDAPLLNNYAWFSLVSAQPDREKALELAQQAKELDPDNPQMRDTLGWIYHVTGKYYRAEPELEYAAQQLPGNSSILYHLGANQVSLEKLEDGLKNLRRALELHRQGSELGEVESCKNLIKRTEEKLERRR